MFAEATVCIALLKFIVKWVVFLIRKVLCNSYNLSSCKAFCSVCLYERTMTGVLWRLSPLWDFWSVWSRTFVEIYTLTKYEDFSCYLPPCLMPISWTWREFYECRTYGYSLSLSLLSLSFLPFPKSRKGGKKYISWGSTLIRRFKFT